MGVSVDDLVESTLCRLNTVDASVSLEQVITLAIKGKGIFHEPDIKRLLKVVRSAIEERKAKAKRPSYDEYPDSIRNAVDRFASWSVGQNLLPKDLKDPFRFKVNYKKLTRYVFMFVESVYGHLPRSERPDVFEVEACLRSKNARKAAATRRAKKEKATKPLSRTERGKRAAKALRDQQRDLFQP